VKHILFILERNNGRSNLFSPVETKGYLHDEYRSGIIMVMYSPGKTTSYPDEPIDSGLRYHFLGGGSEVGNVGLILEGPSSNRLLIDYGLAPTDPPRYPDEAPKITDTIVTHSHIDHIGMVPWLVGAHRSRLHATHVTVALSELMWNDCHKVSRIEGYPLPWDKRDLDEALNSWTAHSFGEWNNHGDWKWRLHSAGHIPGAAMIEIDTGQRKVLISGDFDTRNSPLVNGANPIQIDTLFVEGTYGGREHPDKSEEKQRFLDKVREIVDRGGTALIPAFANGRGQDVLLELHSAMPELNVHYDGMGKTITKHYLNNPEYLRDSEALEKAFKWVKRVSSKSDKKKALDADVIVSTSGMLDGGPSIWYLNRLRHDPKNAILFMGYQAKGSGGRRLQEEGRVEIFGNLTPIDLEWDSFDFSTHAGHADIVEFAEACGAKDVVVYHTDPNQARPPLVEALEKNGHTVHQPKNGESYVLQ